MERKHACITLSPELMGEMMNLKNGISIADIQMDRFAGNTIKILFESNKYPALPEGAMPISISPEDVAYVSKPLYVGVVKANLTYGDALEALKQGKAITRSIWKGYWTLEKLEGLSKPTIVATLRNTGEKVSATAYQEDMLANDWMIVEIPKPKKTLLKLLKRHRDLLFAIGRQEVCLDHIGLDMNKYWRPFCQLVAEGVIQIIPFSEGEIMRTRLTKMGLEQLEMEEKIHDSNK